ncbi:MAG: UDP-N-acetylmuramoyl-L-alanine--D-glutamate ligase [Campylobacteraceae bacterium]|jgi:UDP-N-acetylmuramoylalanine--D-glutamate ligase|nr:UDP-N-acetylmuramoyl-L-alanine--D-glutamate ligase [Campylobacteraceae bacterium]
MKISLFGHGVTTKAIAKRFAPDCFIYDDKFKEDSHDEFGNRLLACDNYDANLSDVDIPSPGFPPNHRLIKKAKHLTSEYDFFDMPPSVWISGTNGKTTTTQMLKHLLSSRGAIEGGNIGKALANLDKNAPLWILETSSFTLHYTNRTAPEVYLLLPIRPDHISWHGSFEEYEKAKLKPLLAMREGSVAIVPKEYANTPSNAMLIGYENSADLAKTMNIDIDKINIKEPFLLDALLALSAAKILFDEASIDKINTFKIDRHKLEEFYDKKCRLWVNDTKGTNIDATIEALKRYKDKKILIVLGGDDKGVDLTRFFEFMRDFNVEIFAIGSNAQKIMTFSKNIDKTAHECKTLDVAVKEIDKRLDKDDVGLLSPAAASLDQFSSYIERGELFMSLVKALV